MTAAYPELRVVVVMHGDNLSYAETFQEALQGLFKKGKPVSEPEAETMPVKLSFETLIERANTAFLDYLKYLETI